MLRKGGDGVSSRGLLDRLLEPVGDHAVTLGGLALVVQSHRRGGVPEAVLHLADGGARLGAEGGSGSPQVVPVEGGLADGLACAGEAERLLAVGPAVAVLHTRASTTS